VNSFYIFLTVAIFLGVFLGYLTGFKRIFFLLIKITLSVTMAFFLYPVVAGMIGDHIILFAEWSQQISFITVFLLSFILLQLLFRGIERKSAGFNKTIINKMAGAVTGLVAGFAIILLLIQFTNAIVVPAGIENEMKERGVIAAVNEPVEWINDKFLPVFQNQPTQVMALKEPAAVPEAGIKLGYATDDFEMRHDLEAAMLTLVNKERINAGLKPLFADTELAAAATAHTADMLKRGYFSHNTPEGIDPFRRLQKLHITYRYAGENLAMAPTLLKAHEGLMQSPGHRANILNPAYGRIGIGILDAGAHGLMITQEFRN
jgi:uncharacterized protein YkwD/uncharacterized membrane protein required for colicin V production